MGSFAGRVDVAEENGGQRVAAFLARQAAHENGLDLAGPRHQDLGGRIGDDDGARVDGGHGRHERILRPRQRQVRPVLTFSRDPSHDHHRHVGLARGRGGVSELGRSRAESSPGG